MSTTELTLTNVCAPVFFFFNDTATTEIYTLSLHDALPILGQRRSARSHYSERSGLPCGYSRSEEHTSELQSQFHLVCRLLLEKKTKKNKSATAKDGGGPRRRSRGGGNTK